MLVENLYMFMESTIFFYFYGPRSGGYGCSYTIVPKLEVEGVALGAGVYVHCKNEKFCGIFMQYRFYFLLCWLLLTPQMVGGEFPLGLVTVKVSVRHCPLMATAPTVVATVVDGLPLLILVTEVVVVLGPAIVKEVKSRRIWQILFPHGQMVAVHAPDMTLLLSKYVQFWLEVPPQPMVTAMIFCILFHY